MRKVRIEASNSREALARAAREHGPDTRILEFNRERSSSGQRRITLVTETRESPGRKVPLIAIISAAALVLVIVSTIILINMFETSVPSESQHASAIAGQSSPVRLVILPLRDLSATGDLGYLCEGIAEAIQLKVSRVKNVRVSSRASAFSVFSSGLTATQAGQRLSVDMILEGSLRSSKNNLSITIHLVNAQDGFQLWSKTYSDEPENLFTLQEQISRDLLHAMSIGPSTGRVEQPIIRYTTNIEADDNFKRGRFLQLKGTIEDMKKSVSYFEKAIELDPEFALAYSHLAINFTYRRNIHGLSDEESFKRAEDYINKAFEIDPDLPEAYCARGFLYMERDFNIRKALVEFNKSVELDPNFALGQMCVSSFHLLSGQLDEAYRTALIAAEIDPLSQPVNRLLVAIYDYQGKYAEAAIQLEKLLDLYPKDNSRRMLHLYLALSGEEESAGEELLHYLGSKSFVESGDYVPMVVDMLENQGFAVAIEDISQRFGTELNPLLLLEYYLYLGKLDSAMEILEGLVSDDSEAMSQYPETFPDTLMMMLKLNPRIAVLKNSERYDKLIKQLEQKLLFKH